MNLSKILKRSAVVLMIAFSIALIPTACTEEVVTNDSTSVSNSLTPASLAAPEITGKAFDGVNYITWKPVKNATGYRLYRDNVWIQDYSTKLDLSDPLNPIYPDDLKYYDYASLSSEIESIKDGQSYTYTVVATGVQASRGTNTSASNNTDFVMTDADILGDSIASVTITAKVPEVFSTVEAAKKVNVKYNGSIVGAYFEKPSYLFAGVSFAHVETGANVDVFTYLAQRMTRDATVYDPYATPTPIGNEGADGNYTYRLYMTKAANQYVWTPAYAGKYKYQIITAWPNAFYNNNTDVSGDVEIPALNVDAPEILAYDEADGILIRFKDTIGAEYTLYRAEEQNSNTAYEFTSLVTGSAWNPYKTICGGDDTEYRYLDKTVEYGKKYVYLLTGTKDGKALSFNSSKPAVAYQTHTTGFNWDPQFAAFNNNGTVELSWNVQEGITYKVLKCTYASNTATTHTEEYLNNGAVINVGTPTLGVFVMTDTITKLPGTGYYKYTLIGENAAKSVNKLADQITSYNTTAATFDLAVAGGFDSNKNGIYDKVDITITVNNQYKDVFGDLSAANAVTFYRAVVAADNKDTSAGTGIEFVSGYGAMTSTQIQFIKKAENSTEIVYTYRDTSLSEGDIADNAYAYAAVLNDTAKTSAVVACQLCSKAITLPDIQIKKDSTSANLDSFKVYWNGEFADSTIPAAASTADPDTSKYNAATVSLWYAYTMASTIGDVLASEWNKKADITAANFVDGTYLSDEIVLGEAQSDKQYLYIRVLFNNADNVDVVDRVGPPAYKNHWDSAAYTNKKFDGSITNITSVGTTKDPGKTTIKPSSGTPVDGCYIMTNGTLDNITVWVTWLNAGGEILANPIEINPVRQIPDNSDNTTNGYYVEDQKSWYFTDEPAAAIKSDVAKVLVHITNTQGKVLRDVETGIWW